MRVRTRLRMHFAAYLTGRILVGEQRRRRVQQFLARCGLLSRAATTPSLGCRAAKPAATYGDAHCQSWDGLDDGRR